jgi:hypothetical protein
MPRLYSDLLILHIEVNERLRLERTEDPETTILGIYIPNISDREIKQLTNLFAIFSCVNKAFQRYIYSSAVKTLRRFYALNMCVCV